MIKFKLIAFSIFLNLGLITLAQNTKTIAVLGIEFKEKGYSCINEVPLKSILETENKYKPLSKEQLLQRSLYSTPTFYYLEEEKKCKQKKKRLINLAKKLDLDLIITGRIYLDKRQEFKKIKKYIIKLELINVENGEIEAKIEYDTYQLSSVTTFGLKFAIKQMLVTDSYNYNAEKTLVKKSKETSYKDTITDCNWQKNRYFLTSSGYGLEKNQLILRRTLSLGYAEYGLSKNFSIAAGTEVISTILGKPIWFIKPKATTQLFKNVNMSIGLLEMGMKDEVYATLGSANLTIGSPSKNITVGVLFDGAKKFKLNQTYVYTLSAIYSPWEQEPDDQMYLIFESFIAIDKTELNHFTIIGYRAQNEKKSIEGGLMFSSNSSETIASPYISYSWNIPIKTKPLPQH